MREITIDQIDRAITTLKLRAHEQRKLLSQAQDRTFTDSLRPAHANLLQTIYRMTRIRDGLLVDQPDGHLH